MTKLSSSILDHVVFQTYYSSYFLKCPLRKPSSKTDIVTKLHIMKTLNFEHSHQKEKKRKDVTTFLQASNKDRKCNTTQ